MLARKIATLRINRNKTEATTACQQDPTLEEKMKTETEFEVIFEDFLKNLPFFTLSVRCSIPDDHIDPRRSAFFMARSVLGDIREGNQC